MHASDVVTYVLHRAWAKEGNTSCDVFETAGFQLGKHSPHACGFHLKDANRLAAGEEFVNGGVVQRDGV